MNFTISPIPAKWAATYEENSLAAQSVWLSTAADAFQVNLSTLAVNRNELVSRFKASVHYEDKMEPAKNALVAGGDYDDTFLYKYAATYCDIFDELNLSFSGQELASRVAALDGAFSQAAEEAAGDLSRSFAAFFYSSEFEETAFRSHLVTMAKTALSAAKQTGVRGKVLEQVLSDKLQSEFEPSPSLTTMSYSDVHTLSELFKRLPTLTSVRATSPKAIATLMAAWFREGQAVSRKLSGSVRQKIQATITRSITQFHSRAAISLVTKRYEETLDELTKELDKLSNELKKVSKRLSVLMKQPEKDMDQICRWLKRQNELSSQINGLRAKMQAIIKERDEFFEAPMVMVKDTQEYAEIESAFGAMSQSTTGN